MVFRIAGINIPAEKKVYVGLTDIYGVGFTTAKKACVESGVNPEIRVKELGTDEAARIREYITKNYKIGGELSSEISQNIKSLKDLKCYRGLRHIRRLPVNGQRTRTNARTRKGRSAPVAGKKKA